MTLGQPHFGLAKQIELLRLETFTARSALLPDKVRNAPIRLKSAGPLSGGQANGNDFTSSSPTLLASRGS